MTRAFPSPTFRASSLSTYLSCPRRFAAQWVKASKLEEALGFKLNTLPQTIGAALGTAAHRANEYFMRHRMLHDNLDEIKVLDTGLATAKDSLQRVQEKGVLYDKRTIPDYEAAETILARMVRGIWEGIPKTLRPVMIEKALSTMVMVPGKNPTDRPHKVHLTGTIDLYMAGNQLCDLKTSKSKNPPYSYAQMGAYAKLLRDEGIPVDVIKIFHLPRPNRTGAVKPLATYDVHQPLALEHSRRIIAKAAPEITALCETRDPEQLLANPADMLCSPKYCPAFGTSFCTLGHRCNPQKMEDLER